MQVLIVDDSESKMEGAIVRLRERRLTTDLVGTLEEATLAIQRNEGEIGLVLLDGVLQPDKTTIRDDVFLHGNLYPSLVSALVEDPFAHRRRRLVAMSTDPDLRIAACKLGCDASVDPLSPRFDQDVLVQAAVMFGGW